MQDEYDFACFSPDSKTVYVVNGTGITDLNERERYFCEEQEKAGSYIYVYELSTGKFVQAERIEDEGKRIEAITLSPDGEYISIRIRDGAHFNECHQVICKIDLEKEARSLPKIAKNEDEENPLKFLLNTSFDLDVYWSLNFFYDGHTR